MQERLLRFLTSTFLSVALACGCSSPGAGGNDGGTSSGGAAANGPIGTSGTGVNGGNFSTSGTGAGATGPGPGAGNTGTGGNVGTAGTGPGPGAGNAGTVGTAGTGTGGGPGGGGGYWTSKDWHGCSWTGVGTMGGSTIMPQDFTTKAPAAPYCVSGTVGPLYEAVALLGFNVNEPSTANCTYKPVDPNAPGPPSVMPQANGIAVNFSTTGAFTLRVQIQGPNGAMPGTVGENDRWCATITETMGKVFVPYTSFTPRCWEEDATMRGTPYARQPISAVVFTVPGILAPRPYNFCINGFTYGTSPADAPDGPAVGTQMGAIGGPGAMDLDFSRVKVTVDNEQYIIQNNNWGNPAGTDLVLSYVNNSFKITSGSGSGGDAPASFPSIYIGNNGNTANGVYSTRTTDNLPAQISAIQSIPSTLRYSGTTGQFNAAYDIWFANSPPTAEYRDGINGFVMVWLRDPSGKQPIGNQVATNVMVAGQPWNVWVGPRGNGPAGPNNAPVVSFVNPTENSDNRAQSFVNVDLKAFITAAAQHGIGANLYLTDVFGGFEIWQGGSGGNLGVDEFKAVVNR